MCVREYELDCWNQLGPVLLLHQESHFGEFAYLPQIVIVTALFFLSFSLAFIHFSPFFFYYRSKWIVSVLMCRTNRWKHLQWDGWMDWWQMITMMNIWSHRLLLMSVKHLLCVCVCYSPYRCWRYWGLSSKYFFIHPSNVWEWEWVNVINWLTDKLREKEREREACLLVPPYITMRPSWRTISSSFFS